MAIVHDFELDVRGFMPLSFDQDKIAGGQ